MKPEDIQLGQSYWVQIGPHAMRVKVVALPAVAELWMCEDSTGKHIACAITDFIGPASWL